MTRNRTDESPWPVVIVLALFAFAPVTVGGLALAWAFGDEATSGAVADWFVAKGAAARTAMALLLACAIASFWTLLRRQQAVVGWSLAAVIIGFAVSALNLVSGEWQAVIAGPSWIPGKFGDVLAIVCYAFVKQMSADGRLSSTPSSTAPAPPLVLAGAAGFSAHAGMTLAVGWLLPVATALARGDGAMPPWVVWLSIVSGAALLAGAALLWFRRPGGRVVACIAAALFGLVVLTNVWGGIAGLAAALLVVRLKSSREFLLARASGPSLPAPSPPGSPRTSPTPPAA